MRSLNLVLVLGLLVVMPADCAGENPTYHPPGHPVDLDHPVEATVAKPNLFFVGGVQIVGDFTAVCDKETGITYINGKQWMPAPSDCPEEEYEITEERAEALYGNSSYLRGLMEAGTLSSWQQAADLIESSFAEMNESARRVWISVQRDQGRSREDAQTAVLEIVVAWPLCDPDYEPHFAADDRVVLRPDDLPWELGMTMPDPFFEPPPPPTPEELQGQAELWLGTLIEYLQDPRAKCLIVYSCWVSMLETGDNVQERVDHLRACFQADRYVQAEAGEHGLTKKEINLILANTQELDAAGW